MIEPPRHPNERPGTTAVAAGPASLFADNINVARGDVSLEGITVRARGGVVAVLGPNGSGKTTLLRALATVAPVDSGSIRIDGLDVADPAARTEIRFWLGYGPQATRFHDATRVFDAIDYVATLRLTLATEDRQRETWRVIDQLDLRRSASTKLGELSEGNRQRVTLAQALLGPPRYAVLDEPLVALDPEIRLQARAAITELSTRATVVMASHFVDEAASLAEHIIVLGRRSSPAAGSHEDGVVFSGSAGELAALADGQVWVAPPGTEAAPGTLSWRTEQGVLRGIGQRPLGAEPTEPLAADGYLALRQRLTNGNRSMRT